MTSYTGRFAPSPTGPLHLGSLIAAVGSYLDARANRGRWLVRIEDIDPPREMPGASDLILQQLEDHGLRSDAPPGYQSQRSDRYQACLEQLITQGHIFACDCSRQRVKDIGGLYDGHCRTRGLPLDADAALRVRLDAAHIGWQDLIQGQQQFSREQLGGDFILRRRDGLFSYQLAVAADDVLDGITRVVRGADLLDSTARQIHLQQLLGLDSPHYAHLPVIENHLGQKLSKQTHAPALAADKAVDNLLFALQTLGLTPADGLHRASPGEILDWATRHWQLQSVPKTALRLPKDGNAVGLC